MQKKKLMIVGGMGYVGKKLVRMAAKIPEWSVYSVQRSDVPNNMMIDNVEYIKGDAMNPEKFIDKIKQTSSIVHTVGTLIDNVVLRKTQIGGPGSYEQMNFETAKRMGDAFNSFSNNKNRNFVYISANHAPPFLPRYLQTKIQAENYLKELDNFNFYSVRPGIITDSQRFFTIPLGKADKPPLKQIKNIKCIGSLLKQFEVDESISRETLCKAILYLAISNSKNKLQINIGENLNDAALGFENLIKK